MARQAPDKDQGETDLTISTAKGWAAGVPGVVHGLTSSVEQMGVRRSAQALMRVNQPDGFDCPGCAWPEPGKTHVAEFCENGAKAVAEEATLRRITPAFFAEHSISDLRTRSDYWLGQQGRLTEPMIAEPGSDHYRPISYDEALDLIAATLRDLPEPDQAIFYTSGRTSNEAAFLYQLFVRAFGTNNLPDCSNMCHESSGAALSETIGIGKGTVTLNDVVNADLIFINGQNPGTNHPRMLTALERAKEAGTKIIAVNPLPEAGLRRFKNPQKVSGVLGRGTELADHFSQIRVNGDLAYFQALGALLVETDRVEGGVLDHDFIAAHTSGFEEWAASVADLDWDEVRRATGIERSELEEVARMVRAADSVVVCWAMGLTQHKNSVPTIREIVNFLLLRGNIGRPGAGVCPVRGHSNVQGDRTMGIWEKPPAAFLDALDREFSITSPRRHGHDVVNAIRAMRRGEGKVFFAMGGNFVRATPDSGRTEEALASLDLTVQVSTKLNSSHAVVGRTAIILPTLGRTEADRQATGSQFVTVEDSMGMVHASTGRLAPADPGLRSEVALVCDLAGRAVPESGIDWAGLRDDYDRIRDHIGHVVPGFADFNARVRAPGGFALPNGPRDSRTFVTSTGRARFTENVLEVLDPGPGRLILQTVRSHDQFNTTIYGLDDRYRGVKAGRRVVFVNPYDLAELGFADGDLVDLVSEWPTAAGLEERRAEQFRVIDFPTAAGCAAAYFPETNVLVPLDSVAEVSNTPTSKSVVIRLEPADQSAPAPMR
ncbi:MAG: FdhF/YdeP family oxidoreductase [Propionibacteriaceae bacterium]